MKPNRHLAKWMIGALALATPWFVWRSYHDQKSLAEQDRQLKHALSAERRALALQVAGRLLKEAVQGKPWLMERDRLTGEITGLGAFLDARDFRRLAGVQVDAARPLSGPMAELLRSSSRFFSGLPHAYAGLVECLSHRPVICAPADAERLYTVARRLFHGEAVTPDQFALIVNKLPDSLHDAFAYPLFVLCGSDRPLDDNLWIRCRQNQTTQFTPIDETTLDRLNRSVEALDLGAVFALSSNWLDLRGISSNLELTARPLPTTFARLMWNHSIALIAVELILAMVLVTLIKTERLNQVQRTFLAAGTHELRTPLAVIRQFSEMLVNRKTRFDRNIQRYHRFIYQECLRMHFLVENLLSQARAERLRLRLNIEWFDVKALVDETVRTLEPIHEHPIKWTCPNETVAWDRMYLSQVLINLLENARRHGKSDVELRVRPRGDEIEISVRDFGSQMDESRRREIADSRRVSHRTKGLGLGLMLCRTIIKAHGGTLDFELGSPGLLVRVRLPREAGKPGGSRRSRSTQRRK